MALIEGLKTFMFGMNNMLNKEEKEDEDNSDAEFNCEHIKNEIIEDLPRYGFTTLESLDLLDKQDSLDEFEFSSYNGARCRRRSSHQSKASRGRRGSKENKENAALCEIPESAGSKENRETREYNEIVERAKYIVDKAVKNRKVFIMYGKDGRVRRCLKRRGWLEKPFIFSRIGRYTGTGPVKKDVDLSYQGTSGANLDTLVERFLGGVSPNLVWCNQRNKLEWKRLRRDQLVNKFPHARFTTKIGIHSCLENLYWFTNYSMHSFFPRCYQVFIEEERKAFIEDYRNTACINVVKWFVNSIQEQGNKVPESRNGRIRRTLIEFSLSRCEEYVKYKENLDLDSPPPQLWEHQWEQFLTEYYTLIQGGARIQEYYEVNKRSEELLTHSKRVLEKLRKVCPQYEMDGVLNLWIIKPGSSSRGRGISITNKLERILSMINGKQSRYVVQKYIERPMLIYNTKFDIRQWVLVTDWNPLVIWLYKPSYLRFCSQPFKLEDFHESIHLCNNAIQAKYKNGERSTKLPDDNMWDNTTFSSYLSQSGLENSWEEIIYPSIKKCLIGTLISTQEMMDTCTKKNCFELYGADFMLTPDLKPWLLEINSSPALGPTTHITARLCANVLDDVIKVTVDRMRNKNADTGGFELVYKQPTIPHPQYSGLNFSVQGSKLPSAPRSERMLIQDGLQYYSSSKLRISPTNDNLQALFAEAEMLTRGNSNGNPRMVELIDTIMSIPSCLQDQESKIQVVNKWIKERKLSEEREEKKAEQDKAGDRNDTVNLPQQGDRNTLYIVFHDNLINIILQDEIL
ncbi:tubulin monoglycylase TTLL3 [Eurytemora carolleeae]|uniref:tubulin monoglycylase TTLL3 n=1 Tax=Eurytemora carolleeae TaxID=1294199 RepID=UPI000C761C41|nr:tubulin monoglycylase TTLL3 [Eurytemora carolleeae]|eukprot:XP_023323881.1 tubulin monoglycylase TTLL3-like [Eurytemora affinis]